MTKKNLMPIVVLTAICVVVAALLGVVNMLTAPIIAEAESQKVYDSFRNVLDGVYEDATVPETAPNSVTAMYKVTDKDGKLLGRVATVTVKGYADNISVTVGVDADGKVTKAEVTASAETHGKAGMKTYTDNFKGLDAAGVAGVDTFTGATASSKAIRGAILDAVNAVTGGTTASPPPNEDDSDEEDTAETLPKTDEEIKSLVREISGISDISEVSLWSKPDSLKRLYSVGDGYCAYIVVPGEYVPVATEAVVYINSDGDIDDINLLSWVVGHGVEPGDFADGFVGKDTWHVDDVDLVSGATGTSNDFRSAIKEVMTTVATLLKRSDKKLLELADELVIGKNSFTLMDIPEGAPTSLKRLYRVDGTEGSIAYIVNPGEYVEVATEALVHFDNFGKVKNIMLLTWSVGHGVEPGDFTNKFIGKKGEQLNEVELVTSATYTSQDLRTSIYEASKYVPTSYVYLIIGAAVIAVALVGAVALTVIKRRRVAVK